MTEKHPTSPQTDPKEQRRHDYMRSDKRQDHGTSHGRHGHNRTTMNSEERFMRKVLAEWDREDIRLEALRTLRNRARNSKAVKAWEMNDVWDENGRIKTQWDDELDFVRPPAPAVEVPLADWERELLEALPARSDQTPDFIDDVTANTPRKLYTSDADPYVEGWAIDPDTVSQSVLNDMDDEETIDDGWRASGDPYPWGRYENEDDIWALDDPVVWPEVDEYDDDDYDREPVSEDQAAWLFDTTGELTRAFSGRAYRLGRDAIMLTNKMYDGVDYDADLPDWVGGFHIEK